MISENKTEVSSGPASEQVSEQQAFVPLVGTLEACVDPRQRAYAEGAPQRNTMMKPMFLVSSRAAS